MKKLLILFLMVTSSVFAQFGSPKIVPLESEFNFGDIKEGEVVTHKFIVFNKGGDSLKITKVKASCGCTAASPTKTDLLPEESTSIEVKFNTNRKRGKQRKFVYIFSNDPDTPQLRLTFHANVIAKAEKNYGELPSIKLSKYNHNFGNVKEGAVLDLSIDVMNNGTSDLKINRIKSSCGCTAAMMTTKVLKPNETGQLKIEFDTKKLSGQVARTVTLFTNDPKHPTRVITLIANIEKG